jgi:hypothetical protein
MAIRAGASCRHAGGRARRRAGRFLDSVSPISSEVAAQFMQVM